jgi:hypothetical protein
VIAVPVTSALLLIGAMIDTSNALSMFSAHCFWMCVA